MTGKLVKVLFCVFVVAASAGYSFGQDINAGTLAFLTCFCRGFLTS